jgi:hypothetical protein
VNWPGATDVAGAAFSVLAKQLHELGEQVRLRSEVTEMLVPSRLGLGHRRDHLLAIVAVKGIALDEAGIHLFAKEYLLEGALDGRGPRSRGTGNRQDGMFSGHG